MARRSRAAGKRGRAGRAAAARRKAAKVEAARSSLVVVLKFVEHKDYLTRFPVGLSGLPAGTSSKAQHQSEDQVPGLVDGPGAMAPSPMEQVDESIKKTVHSLYAIQSATHGYVGPETQAALAQEIKNLSQSLIVLDSLSNPGQGTSKGNAAPTVAALSEVLLPPEILDYVDSGRNPQIYTREFVELVQKGNSYLKGKSEALEMFRDKLATEMTREWPEMREDVEKAVGRQ